MKKTLNELINILVDEKIITEEFKKLIITASEREKKSYLILNYQKLYDEIEQRKKTFITTEREKQEKTT